jgi:hypothetical protein
LPQEFQEDLKKKDKGAAKIMEKMFTNDKGEAAYEQRLLMTSAGPIISDKCQYKI